METEKKQEEVKPKQPSVALDVSHPQGVWIAESSKLDERRSATIGALAKALAAAQREMKAADKSQQNPHLKSKYADLDDVIESIQEPLAKNGLAYIQTTITTAKGWAGVDTELVHESGEWVKSRTVLPVLAETPPGYGATLTYARRYGLAAIVGARSALDGDEGGHVFKSTAGGQPASEVKERMMKPAQKATAPQPRPTARAITPGAAEQGVQNGKPDDFVPPEPPPLSDEEMAQLDAQGEHADPATGEVTAKPARKMPPIEVIPDVPEEQKNPDGFIPYGKEKGKHVTEVGDRSLEWLAEATSKSVQDPDKQRFQKKNQAFLDAITQEQARRAG